MKLTVKLFALASACAAASPAFARTEFHPYLEADQIVDAQLRGGGDVLTYSALAAGIDMSAQSERTQVELSYRYERRIGWGKAIGDNDVHSGLARAAYQVIPGVLTLEGGAVATRARQDFRGAAPQLLGVNSDNVTQVYQAYVGPTLSTNIGQLEVGASYRAAYTATDGGQVTLPVGQQPLDTYDHSLAHFATASIGMAPGAALPVGWNVQGYYNRENGNQLDQRFVNQGVRGEVVYPVSSTVSVVGGVGYEKVQESQRAALLDATGNPVVDARGRFATDPASPRVLGYDFDGVYWDAGVEWRPSRRTSMQFAVGRRYGSMSYTGSISWQASENSALQIGVYDQIETFGGQLNGAIRRLPSQFSGNNSAIGQSFGGCTFGKNTQSGGGTVPGGGCLNSALSSASTDLFRSRGVSAQFAASMGRASYGIGVGYSQRKFLAAGLPGVVNLNGSTDESYYLQGNFGYALSRRSNFDANAYANYFNPGVAGAPNVLNTGATGSFTHNISRNLSARAALGLYSFRVDGETGNINMSGQVGVRYSF